MSLPISRSLLLLATVSVAPFCTIGCNHISGRPGPGPEVVRPEQVLDFETLYKANCAACHGSSGTNGAAIPLANSVYLAFAGEATLADITGKGVHGSLMPFFAKSAGGTLTDQQVNVLAQGMIEKWGKPEPPKTPDLPAYRVSLAGDATRGQQAYGTFCASCHGIAGEGTTYQSKGSTIKLGSIVDESYLALISDQALRSFIIAGRPDQGMPDWRSDAAQPMTDQQITDVVAWLASKRTANPGQPYPVHP
jgi:mono/diheme cytochrome c family protein